VSSPIITVLVVVLSFFPSSQEMSRTVFLLPFGDKGAHAIAYAAFGFCFQCAVAVPCPEGGMGRRLRNNRRHVLIVMAASLALGTMVELAQPWFGRNREAADLAADGIGAAIGIALAIAVFAFGERLERRRNR